MRIKTATISLDGRYRYDLTRQWDDSPNWRPVLWVMLNPSTADAEKDDPTIRRVERFTKDLFPDAGGFVVVNLFALRCTRPVHLLDDPLESEGELNRVTIRTWLRHRRLVGVVCAWGAWYSAQVKKPSSPIPTRLNIGALAVEAGHVPYCLGHTFDDSPRHPLYVPADQPLVPFLKRRPS